MSFTELAKEVLQWHAEKQRAKAEANKPKVVPDVEKVKEREEAKARQAALDAAAETARKALEEGQRMLRAAEARALRRQHDELARAEHERELREGIARMERKAAKRAAKGR